MSEITFDQVEAEVRRLAEENPEFEYETYAGTCFYNAAEREGRQYGACIFGQAFGNLGEPVPEEHENKQVGYVLEMLDIKTTVEQYLWAGDVQMKQDRGSPWGEAVKYADREY